MASGRELWSKGGRHRRPSLPHPPVAGAGTPSGSKGAGLSEEEDGSDDLSSRRPARLDDSAATVTTWCHSCSKRWLRTTSNGRRSRRSSPSSRRRSVRLPAPPAPAAAYLPRADPFALRLSTSSDGRPGPRPSVSRTSGHAPRVARVDRHPRRSVVLDTRPAALACPPTWL